MTEITDPAFYRTPADAIAAAPESLALAGGVLAQAARVSLRAACRNLQPGRLVFSGPAAATAVAAAITVLAVHAVG